MLTRRTCFEDFRQSGFALRAWLSRFADKAKAKYSDASYWPVHLATPPCREQDPARCAEWLYLPSLHWATAPLGLVFTVSPLPALAVREGALAGFGAGATVVRAGVDDVEARQVARILLYHFEQSTVVAVVLVVFETAPGVFPVGVSLAAVRQAPLLALPGFVQS